MTAPAPVHELEHGSRNSTGTWTPFNWDDPLHGAQSKGEVVTIRTGGTTGGNLAAGLWRTGPGIAGCNDDGTVDIVYSAPLGDETMVLLEGSADVLATASGKKYHFKAGDILAHPKHLDLKWHVHGPFLKKFWVIWDAPVEGTKSDELFVGNINDNPDDWAPYTWDEPGKGSQTAGELRLVRKTGSTGLLNVGVWRSGRGLPGATADGTTTFEYSSPLGDETIMVLEGEIKIEEHESGKVHSFKGGDIFALPSGLKVTWTSVGPFTKKYFVITNGQKAG
ncbi:hypothetical protein FVEG_13492 [Fusarium verticillioides 7600]|uniref:(S)-ureidoglycine aminohydrolase cupin domain-containing protein n=1 Tax=Gibberella moniliformis (strain M3125 / FGSC 7600) TaxID=334819 RepID=W7N607_GIBM7|nr:hypothetical protein FVEG_13492 [Fusarium verticillioides 7600]EWG55500.1 hypothetical protein FVEG_13492 [Fusarium verticillioides 7600]RBQ96738.1 hypothetical protein FVER53263_13492 [Fusarium verticillioides]